MRGPFKLRKYIRNEKGLTLVEVLAVLLIGTLFLALTMTMMLSSMRMNYLQAEKSRMQQEANIVLAKLSDHHRMEECYKLSVDASEHPVVSGCEPMDRSMPLMDTAFRYEIQTSHSQIRPKVMDLDLTMTIKSKEKENIKVTVETTLYRLKTLN